MSQHQNVTPSTCRYHKMSLFQNVTALECRRLKVLLQSPWNVSTLQLRRSPPQKWWHLKCRHFKMSPSYLNLWRRMNTWKPKLSRLFKSACRDYVGTCSLLVKGGVGLAYGHKKCQTWHASSSMSCMYTFVHVRMCRLPSPTASLLENSFVFGYWGTFSKVQPQWLFQYSPHTQ